MNSPIEVVVIGAGPSGLAAATEIRRLSGTPVVVLEREADPGGIPRHSDHTGYGIRDMRRVLSGPAYAKELVRKALQAGVEIRTSTMITQWGTDGVLHCTSPSGRSSIDASAVLLASGARERARAARRIPGTRPGGVLTTGELQNAVHLHDQRVGRRALIIGAELVSWSAVLTLRHAGCRTVGLVSEHHRPESYAPVNALGPALFRAPIHRDSRVTRILGSPRVEAVEITNDRTGARTIVECDTVVTTADWIPDHELARQRGLTINPSSKGIVVDPTGRTSVPGVYAAGNCVHPVDTADIAALSGKHVARSMLRYLEKPEEGQRAAGVRLEATKPLRWVSPGWYVKGEAPSRRHLSAWSDDFVRFPTVVAEQNGTEVGRIRLPWPAAPGRMFRIPWKILDGCDATAGPVTLLVR